MDVVVEDKHLEPEALGRTSPLVGPVEFQCTT